MAMAMSRILMGQNQGVAKPFPNQAQKVAKPTVSSYADADLSLQKLATEVLSPKCLHTDSVQLQRLLTKAS